MSAVASKGVSSRRRMAAYAVAIFLSSAGLMALEITAARLLAPYIGVSLYSWTAIIGVVLGGISLGNWIGGIWVDRGADERSAGWILGIGGLACVAILLLLTLVAPALQGSELGLMSLSFVYVAALFLLPALLLGIVTPILTTLALRLDARTGRVIGMIDALGALGSIVGTFLTGYVLIQAFGTRSIILGTAAMLALLALLLLWRSWRSILSLSMMALIVIGLTAWRNGFANHCDRETNYFCIRVVDLSQEVEEGQMRGMVLDHLMHGINHREYPTLLMSPYVHLMDELISLQAAGNEGRPLRTFFSGGGAYTQPRALRMKYPDAEIVVAELDPAVTEMAKRRLYYDGGQDRIIHSDGRQALLDMPVRHFDVIVGDVFHDIAIPQHLVTREYIDLVESRLTAQGMYLMNVVDAQPDPRLVKSMVKTLRTRFSNVQVWLQTWDETPARMTYVLIASNNPPFPPRLMSQRGFNRQWQDVSHLLASTGTDYDRIPILTDDYAPVESLLSTLLLTELGR
ncbi:MAG: spermidine synthase [Gammaproteobacteria bacterium]|nr:spermidine synthase [Gammaproteobacteria bacterium]